MLNLRWAIVAIALLAAAALVGAYLISRIAAGGDATASADSRTTYRIGVDTLHRSVTYPAVAQWNVVGEVFAPRSGTMTELGKVAGLLSAGDVVARIDERPAIIVPGDVPAFRALAVGVTGRDVAALHAFLASRDYAVDPSADEFTDVSAEAIRNWQSDVGYPVTGEVELGDILFIPAGDLTDHLFRFAPDLAVGSQIGTGAPLLAKLAPTPLVEVNLGPLPPAEITPGSTVRLTLSDEQNVPGTIAELTSRDGQVIAVLANEGEDAICAEERCLELVPLTRDAAGTAEITLVPETTGPVVPSAAILTSAAGEPYVELASGGTQRVSIVLSAGGLSVVDGIDAGVEIVLP